MAQTKHPDLDIEVIPDPRDVRLSRPQDYLRWALDHVAWVPTHREVLEALWFESGDVKTVARIMDLDVEYVSKLKTRARSEVIFAAKELDWEWCFSRTRLSGEWPHRSTLMRVLGGPIWFVGPEARGDFREVEV